MGKPFKTELSQIPSTMQWADNLDVSALKSEILSTVTPVYFVGSGGSLSACHFGVSIMEQQGKFAKVLTPLELHSVRNTIGAASIVIISAGGRNNDILFAFQTSVRFEAKKVICICMKVGSKLAELSNKYSLSSIHEYDLPVGKDGFLATNSLVSYFVILNKALNEKTQEKIAIKNIQGKTYEKFLNSLEKDTTITLLYSGWGKSAAYDIESKSVEAALFPILLADFRNFGHGRHHWFAKKTENSAVIALATPEDSFLAKKTIEALPELVPKLYLETPYNSSLGALDLLIQSFYLVDGFGDLLNIDPGRPGVPPFGRKLYNLKYASFLQKKEDTKGLSLKALNAIRRKVKVPISILSEKEKYYWESGYINFISTLNKGNFGAIVFDYDGTICSSDNKFEGPDEKMTEKLKYILEHGFLIGVVTGRGKSVRKDLQKILPEPLWSQVLLGYYNGSEIGFLNENNLPSSSLSINPSLKKLSDLISLEFDTICSLRANQLSIEFDERDTLPSLKENLIQLIKTLKEENIQILESSHSIDIIPAGISKLNILEPLKNALIKRNIATDLLCIGDRGLWPGNDFKLLNTPYSLSVFEVSGNIHNCWNIAPSGISHTDATLCYLNWLRFEPSRMKLKIAK